MVRMIRRIYLGFSRASFYLLIGSGLLGISAAAQDSSVAHANISNDAAKKKGFKFEVVSIRPLPSGPPSRRAGVTPDGFNSQLSVWQMILHAYAPGDPMAWYGWNGTTRVSNGPQWISDNYEINARVADDDREAWRNQSNRYELLRLALRDVLKERFQLVLHQQSTEVPGLKLVTMRKGAKLKATPPGFTLPPGRKLISGGVAVHEGRMGWHYYDATMEDLASFLSQTSLRPVHDMTGLTGRYEFSIHSIDNPSHDVNEMQDNWPIAQLGLALEPGNIPGLVLILDHIEKPSQN
jgi:uncharacterized protein (TIGR03435 family)